jgi:NhaA family Na+:H+ antiporter
VATERRGATSPIRDFLASEAAGGIVLIVAAAAAMVAANMAATAHGYHALLHLETGPVLAPKLGPMSVHLWINDGLMAAFFLLVGLEIKRELLDGQLSNWERRRLPAIAAAAGMIVPALVYLAIAGGDPALRGGWAIPAATDIAFAIGVLALLGSRAPPALKLFLTTVAIVDDMGAVAIIALFYTAGINLPALAAGAAIFAAMLVAGRMGVRSVAIYLIGFVALWYCVLLSGVHATIAGVIAALAVPIRSSAPGRHDSTLHRLEHGLHPWVAFGIVPLFGFANAGVALGGAGLGQVIAPLPLAVAAGLFLGKQVGIFGSIWIAERLGIATRPGGARWLQIYGLAMLCGIGFTMSLFIGDLAFDDAAAVDAVRLGVLAGSILSALGGYLILRAAHRTPA